MLNYFFKQKIKAQLKTDSHNKYQVILPLKLQAYERIVLFLERISPENLVLRVYRNGMSARFLHVELLKTIRNEFEHNLSQQIYISIIGWDLAKKAKEETIKIINLAAAKCNDNASGADLSQCIMETSAKLDKLPTQHALMYLKKDLEKLYSI